MPARQNAIAATDGRAAYDHPNSARATAYRRLGAIDTLVLIKGAGMSKLKATLGQWLFNPHILVHLLQDDDYDEEATTQHRWLRA